MSDISGSTTVFIFFEDQRGRLWVSGTESRRDRLGNLILEPLLNLDARNAKPWRYDLAQIAARRFRSEGFVPPTYRAKFTFQAGDNTPEIGASESPQPFREDQRVPHHHKGLLAVPGRDVRTGEECWWVRFPGHQIESVRGSSPEEAIDRVFEMNLQTKAERYEVLPEPPAPAPTQQSRGYRRRPGDLR